MGIVFAKKAKVCFFVQKIVYDIESGKNGNKSARNGANVDRKRRESARFVVLRFCGCKYAKELPNIPPPM